MKFKLLFITVFSIFTQINAQVLYRYPDGQNFYEGGREGFIKDIQKAIVMNNVNPCEKTEALLMRFIVYPDNKVKYVSDPDKNAIENNNCLKIKVLEMIKHLKNWKVAEENGKKTPAMITLLFTDDLLFSKKANKDDFKLPVYMHKDKESSVMKFRESFTKCFDANRYRPNGNYSFTINFDVDTMGEAGFFYIDNQSNLEDFNKMVVECASNTKKSYWKPGYYKGVPIKQFFRFPIKFNE